MSSQINKYNVEIPTDTILIYSARKKTLTFSGLLKKKSMRLELKLFVDKSKEIVSISPLIFNKIPNIKRKNIRVLQNTTLIKIKNMLIDSSILAYKKLIINGIGYKASFLEKFNKKLLTLKLGYSHFIYVRIPENLRINCFKKTKLYVSGHSHGIVSKFSALIKAEKLPEPYKGKGISYAGETIILKEGKKI